MIAAGDVPVSIRIQAEPFDPASEAASLSGIEDAGAVVTFAGLCRSEGGRLVALELEHYPGMVEAELRRIVAEACRRWPLTGISIIHRHGRIEAGEAIVLVVTASSHRAAAFSGAAFLMDWLKTRAPFWKREILSDGTVGEWVEAKETDDAAARRWAFSQAAE